MQILFLGLSALEEEIAEPYFSEVGLIFVGCVYLFDCVECFCFEMETLPYLWKSSTAKLFTSKVALNKCFVFQNWVIVGSFENRFLIAVCI